MSETIIEYIKKNLKKGYTTDALRYALVKQGYSRLAIERAIEKTQKELAEKIPKINEKPNIKYELYDFDNKLIKTKKTKKSFFKSFFKK